MDKLNRRSTLAMGLGAAAAILALPLSSFGAEMHPRIHAAIDALAAAREELKAADHDFGGHGKDAIEAIAGALHQLNLAMDWAKAH